MEIPTKNSDKGQQTKMLLKMGFTTYIFQAIFSTFQIFYELFSTLTVGCCFQKSDENFKEKKQIILDKTSIKMWEKKHGRTEERLLKNLSGHKDYGWKNAAFKLDA